MTTHPLRRTLATLLLVLAAVSPALGQPRRVPRPAHAAAAAHRPGLFDLLRLTLERLKDTILPGPIGGDADSNGASTETDSGSKLDPSGRT